VGVKLVSKPEDHRTPEEIRFDEAQVESLTPSHKEWIKNLNVKKDSNRKPPPSRTAIVEMHDRFCHLLAADIKYSDAYKMSGYATSTNWQANAHKLFHQERTTEKVRRFRGGNYSFLVDDLSPDAIMTNMKNLALAAEKASDFRTAAAIYEKIGQQHHGMFLQSKKPINSQRDLAAALGMATAEEIQEQLTALESDAATPVAHEEEEDSTVQ
jgi:hypothetical protein